MLLDISGFLCSDRHMCLKKAQVQRVAVPDQLLLTQLHWFFSLRLLMEPERKKKIASSSLKSSALSVCVFPFLKGHLHNSEQPALLAVSKENFKQA